MRVAKEKLLLIAGFVWLAAGLNIAILGVSAFIEMGEHAMLACACCNRCLHGVSCRNVFQAGWQVRRPY